MLEFLRIQNLALIDDLELEFSAGLNVLTGETGAGKSFILRALGFLTGDKLSADMVRAGADKASVEALFILDGEDVILRRELSGDTGRSRLYINDSLSSQNVVKDLKPKLMLHTSQHAQQRLLSPAYQAAILDAFLPDQAPVKEKDRLASEMDALQAKKSALAERIRDLAEKREYLEFQFREIEKVDPRPGEEEELVAKKRAQKEAAKSRESIDGALSIIHGMGEGLLELMGGLTREISNLAETNADYAPDAQALEEARLTIMDLDARLRREESDAGDYDQESVESRLFELAQLKRRLDRSLDEIVDLRKEIDDNLSFLDSCALDRKQLEKREAALAQELGKAVHTLNAARRKAGKSLAQTLAGDLRELGFSEAVEVRFDFTPVQIHPDIHEDRARLMWIPNPGQAPQPMDKIASGGELSRFLLALTGLMTREDLPSLIFDEVDAGIGGLTLGYVGKRITGLAGRQQVILITHWPQLASLAGRHFQVLKTVENKTTSVSCTRLAEADVFAELARMAGGGREGEALARELLTSPLAAQPPTP